MARRNLGVLGVPLDARQPGESKVAFGRRIHDQRVERMSMLLEHLEIPPDQESTGWRLAVALARQKYPGFRVERKRGVKDDPKKIKEDAILLAGVTAARENAASRKVTAIIYDLAVENDWLTTPENLETKRRRFYELRKKGTKENRRAAKMADQLLPNFVRQSG